ncbi:MAG: TnpV protein [Selenomonadaceae bacterium]|nr:TnpV protein [Selenomonadaceae bacterium]
MIDLDYIMSPIPPITDEPEPEEETEDLELEGYFGQWARIRMQFLIEEKREMWKKLLAEGKAEKYLTDYQEKYDQKFDRLNEMMMEREGATEELKAENPEEWIHRANYAKQAATEMIIAEISEMM